MILHRLLQRRVQFEESIVDRSRIFAVERNHLSTSDEDALAANVHACSPVSLSCVLVSKSPTSCRSCSWLEGSPNVRLTMRPRATAGRRSEEHTSELQSPMRISYAV